MSFRDIQGQDKAVAFLKGSVASGRIAHAYIFYGPQGIGKKLAAIEFAKALNCSAGGDACDECASCRKIASASHPDVMIVAPHEGSRSIGINEIRELSRNVSLKPYDARKKVYIIDGANAMAEEASNALLKTLEEPPTDAVLILIAERLTMLLPTIVSRSQVVTFFALASATVKKILVERYGLEPGRAHILASLASGSAGAALAYRDEKFFAKRSQIVASLAAGTIAMWDFDRTPRADLKGLLAIMLTWYRDILVTKAGGRRSVETVNIDYREAIIKAAGRMSFEELDRALKEIVLTGVFLEQNANPKLAMAALGAAIG